MPIYQYKCENENCLHEFEEFFTSMSRAEQEEPEVRCPECKGLNKKRLVSKTGFVLKGGGWYRDGYSKKSRKD